MLELIVFLSGAGLMIMELAGSRALAPYLGSSIFVWTGLIGVILGALSIGYFLGGRIADKNQSPVRLALILFASGFLVLGAAYFKDSILPLLTENRMDLRSQTLLACIILFGPASIFFGMVSPYAIRLKIQEVSGSGSLVGNLYALSTIGSIVGTFLGGFYIIPLLGTNLTLKLVAGLMMLLGTLYAGSLKLRGGLFLVGALLLVTPPFSPAFLDAKNTHLIHETDTAYNHVRILESTDTRSGRPTRILSTGKYLHQSAMFADRDDELVSTYTKFYRLAEHFTPRLTRALMIGGGAYSYPKDFLHKHPTATLDVVEIDPGLTKIAGDYFNLVPDPQLTIYHEDARKFLNTAREPYDAILIDAFQSFTPPFQLVTKEAIQKQHDLLSEDGVVMINIIGSMEGPQSEYTQAQIRTYQQVFNTVLVFPVLTTELPEIIQNIMVVALKSDTVPPLVSQNAEFQSYLRHASVSPKTGGIILTDDHAPLELYALSLEQGLHELLAPKL